MEKTKEEIILDNRYTEIMECIKNILGLIGVDKRIIDARLDLQELSQTDLDSALLLLISTIVDEDASVEVL